MKKLILSFALLLAAGLVLVRQATAEQRADDAHSPPPEASARGVHTLDAEIVSVDAEKNTVTFRADGVEKTELAGVLCRHRLRDLKPGDKVVVTCKDVAGEHREIMAIRPARADKAGATPEPAKK